MYIRSRIVVLDGECYGWEQVAGCGFGIGQQFHYL